MATLLKNATVSPVLGDNLKIDIRFSLTSVDIDIISIIMPIDYIRQYIGLSSYIGISGIGKEVINNYVYDGSNIDIIIEYEIIDKINSGLQDYLVDRNNTIRDRDDIRSEIEATRNRKEISSGGRLLHISVVRVMNNNKIKELNQVIDGLNREINKPYTYIYNGGDGDDGKNQNIRLSESEKNKQTVNKQVNSIATDIGMAFSKFAQRENAVIDKYIRGLPPEIRTLIRVENGTVSNNVNSNTESVSTVTTNGKEKNKHDTDSMHTSGTLNFNPFRLIDVKNPVPTTIFTPIPNNIVDFIDIYRALLIANKGLKTYRLLFLGIITFTDARAANEGKPTIFNLDNKPPELPRINLLIQYDNLIKNVIQLLDTITKFSLSGIYDLVQATRNELNESQKVRNKAIYHNLYVTASDMDKSKKIKNFEDGVDYSKLTPGTIIET